MALDADFQEFLNKKANRTGKLDAGFAYFKANKQNAFDTLESDMQALAGELKTIEAGGWNDRNAMQAAQEQAARLNTRLDALKTYYGTYGGDEDGTRRSRIEQTQAAYNGTAAQIARALSVNTVNAEQEELKERLNKIDAGGYAGKDEIAGAIRNVDNILAQIEQIGGEDAEERRTQYRQLRDALTARQELYGKYDTQEAFDAAARTSTWYAKYKDKGYKEIEATILALRKNEKDALRSGNKTYAEEIRKERTWLESYNLTQQYETTKEYDRAIAQVEAREKALAEESPRMMLTPEEIRQGKTLPAGDEVTEQTREAYTEMQRLKAQKEALQTGRRLKETEEKVAEKYGDIPLKADFEELSKYVKPEKRDKDSVTYLLANKDEAETMLKRQQNQNLTAEQAGAMWLEEDEIKIYNYLYAKDGKKAADAYLKDMQILLDERAEKNMESAIRKGITEATGGEAVLTSILGSVLSVPFNVAGGVAAGISDVISLIPGVAYNPYNEAHAVQGMAQTIRSAVSQKITEGLGDSVGGQFAAATYQGAMSIGDMALGALLFGGTPLGKSGIASHLTGYGISMGVSAASSRAKELYERGASGWQIGVGSIASGVFEMVFEELSLEQLIKAKAVTKGMTGAQKVRTVIGNVVKQAFTEGSEEFNTDLANSLFDAIMNAVGDATGDGYTTDFEAKINDYMSHVDENGNPYTREEAEKLALRDTALDMWWSFYGGAIAGGVSGAGMTAFSSVMQKQEINNFRKKLDTTSAEQLTEQVIRYKDAFGNEAYELALKIQADGYASDTDVAKLKELVRSEGEQEIYDRYHGTTDSNAAKASEARVQELAEIGRAVRTQANWDVLSAFAREAGMEKLDAAEADDETLGRVYTAIRDSIEDTITNAESAEELADRTESFYEAMNALTKEDSARLEEVYAETLQHLENEIEQAAEDAQEAPRTEITPEENDMAFYAGKTVQEMDAEQAQTRLRALAQKLGVRVAFDIQSKAGVRGFYQNGVIHVNAAMPGKYATIFAHEFTHYLEESSLFDGFRRFAEGTEAYKGYIRALGESRDFERAKENVEKMYRDSYAAAHAAYHDTDIFADFVAEVIFGRSTDQDAEAQARTEALFEKIAAKPKWYQVLRDFLRRMMARLRGDKMTYQLLNTERMLTKAWQAVKESKGAQEAVQAGNEKKNSVTVQKTNYDFSKPFAEQIDDFKKGKFPKGDTLIVRDTPEAFLKIGFSKLPMTYTQKHLATALKNANGDHLGEALLKQLPKALEKPIAIIDSETRQGRAVAIVELQGLQDAVLAAIEVDGYGVIHGDIIDSNAITSAHKRSNAINNLLKNAVNNYNSGQTAIYYWDKTKATQQIQKAKQYAPRSRVQFPKFSNIPDGFVRSITDSRSNVKKKIRFFYETEQFKRWFENSKIVNQNGTPKVLYHQTTEDFSAFDLTRKGAGYYDSELPSGVYMKETPSEIRLGDGKGQSKQMALYASIKNPLMLQNREEAAAFWDKHVPGYAVMQQELDSLTEEYKAREKAIDDQYEDADEWEAETDKMLEEWRERENDLSRKMKEAVDDYLAKSQYDGIILEKDEGTGGTIKTYIALKDTQVKSATDNIGLYDGTNPDIYHSVTIHRADELKPGKLAQQIRRRYKSQADAKSMTEAIRQVKDAADAGAWSEARSIAAKAGKEIAGKIKPEKTEYAQNVLKMIRESRIRLTDTQKSEVAYAFGSEETFRRRHFGTFTITDKGTPLDVVWKELAEAFPGTFDENMNEGDMPSALAAIAETMRNTVERVDTGTVAEMAGAEIFNAAVEARVSEQFEDLKRQLGSVRSAVRSAKQEIKAEYEREATERASRQQMVKAIIRNVKSLNSKLETNSNKKHVPEQLKKPIRAFLRAFTINEETGKMTVSREGVDGLITAYAALRGTEDQMGTVGYCEEVAEYLESIRAGLGEEEDVQSVDFEIKDLTSGALAVVNDIADNLAFIVNNENKIFLNGKREERQAVGWQAISEVREMPEGKHRAGKEEKSGINPLHIGSNLKPIYFFDEMGETMRKIFRDQLEGQYRAAQKAERARAFADETKKKYHYNAWHDQTVEWSLHDGRTWTLTADDLLMLYATLKRERLMHGKHLIQGGLTLKDGGKKHGKVPNGIGSLYTPTYEEIEGVIEKLTQEQREYADEMVTFLTTECAAAGNDVSMNLYGIKRYGGAYYFPYNVDKDYVKKPDTEGKNGKRALKNQSFTFQIEKNANNPIKIESFTDIWAGHVVSMANYAGLAIPIETMKNIYGFYAAPHDGAAARSYKAELLRTKGAWAVKYINKYMDDVNGGVQTQSDYKGLLSRFKKLAVLGNMSVTIKQPTAVGRAFSVIEGKYFGAALPGWMVTRHLYDECKAWCPVAVLKDIGGYDTVNGHSMKDWILDSGYKSRIEEMRENGFRGTIDKALGALPEGADRMTWAMIWAAAKKKAKAETSFEVGSRAYFEAAAAYFNEAIEYTQVYDSVLTRSHNMRMQTTQYQMMTAFMAEPTVTLNMAYRAARDLQAGRMKQAGKKIKGIVVSAFMTALAGAAVRAARDKDENKTYAERFLRDFISESIDNFNPLTMMPVVKDLWSLLDGYDVKRTDVQPIADIIDYIMGIYKKIDKGSREGEWDTTGLVEDAAMLFGTAAGIPTKNLIRDFKALYRFGSEIVENKILPRSWNEVKWSVAEGVDDAIPILETSNKRYYQMLYEAQRAGDEEAFQTVYDHLLANGQDEEKIVQGIRARYRDSKDVQWGVDAYMKMLEEDELYRALDDKKKEQIRTSLRTYVTDVHIGANTGEDISNATSAKAAKAEEQGVSAADYFLAGKLFKDLDGSGGYSKAEKIKAIEEMDLTNNEKQVLISLYTDTKK